MSLEPCARCGETDPRRMVALMKVFFGHLADIPADPGYFYLCPACYTELVEPELPGVLERLRPPPGTGPYRPDRREEGEEGEGAEGGEGGDRDRQSGGDGEGRDQGGEDGGPAV